jgi:hypothetical protein
MPSPLVAVIMGSKSDWETMAHATAALDELGVPYEKHIVSAHRTPTWMTEFALGAEARPGSDHRRSRRRRPSARHDGRAYGAARARRAGAEPRLARARFAVVDRADARRRAGGYARHRQGRRA